jgi:hypothetical protein
MAYEMREGQGSLFKNNKREKDTHPNARGEAMIGGVVYEIAAWTKKDKNGNPWQSLSFKVKGMNSAGEVKPQAQKTKPGHFDDMTDDIPF